MPKDIKIIGTNAENRYGNGIGFILFPARYGEKWGKIPKSEHIFIRADDFAYIEKAVKSVYPFTDPQTGEVQVLLDYTGMNWIDKRNWQRIIHRLEIDRYSDEKVSGFVRELVVWLNEKLLRADEIMLDGTL